MIDQRFTPAGFKLRLALKDIDLLLQTAEESQVGMPAARVVREQLKRAANEGLLEQDVASLALLDKAKSHH